MVGHKTFSLLRNLLAPAELKDQTLETLTTTLKRHYEPKSLVIAERFYFNRRNQLPGESVADFIAELRRLASSCNFGAFLSDALRDRFVCGLRSEAVQRNLIAEEKLELAKAIDMAQKMETAEKNTKDLKETAANPVLNVSSPNSPLRARRPCFRCRRANHDAQHCKFRDATCHSCGKTGHIAPACHKKKARRERSANMVSDSPSNGESDFLSTHMIGYHSARPITTKAKINGKEVTMEVDTGAAVSIISQNLLEHLFPELSPSSTEIVLRTYTGEPIPVVGEVSVDVQHGENSQCALPLIVVRNNGPCLLGRNWLERIRLDWKTVAFVTNSQPQRLESLIEKYSDVFTEELGTITGVQAKLSVSQDARPKFCKPRPVPFALRSSTEQELDRLEHAGVVERVTSSDWAAPIVPVPKKDGRMRICGDYKVTVNPVLDVDQYPLPKPEELFASLAGGKKFSTLDLSHAYQQLLLDEDSRKFVTVNTHRGLYRYKRLPFGIASAPAIFQKTMDSILQGLTGVICYLDDILITGTNDEDHLSNLEVVLQRLQERGIRVKKEKCAFLQSSVEYLGHRIDEQGLHTAESKRRAIDRAPQPQNVQQLRSFLGLLNYYGKFIPNLSTIVQPLNQLLQKDRKWMWTAECQHAFEQAKQSLTSSSVLAHYDPSLPIRMAADASAYGVGAVISHVMPDNTEHPIAYASRTLTSAEQNYSQIEKEALALIFGVKKFHTYLYGRRFTLVTDHKPLVSILGPKKGIPQFAAARLQRWAYLLSAYIYDIEFKGTKEHANADGLSRLPLEEKQDVSSVEPTIFNMAQIQSLPVTASQVAKETCKDSVLSKVLRYTQQGWPESVEECLQPFQRRQHELSVEAECLLWGIRVIIPTTLRQQLLEELHRDHPGITRMKAVARSYMWWPGLDKNIETLAKACVPCQVVKKSPAVAPLHPWAWPEKPWQRVHLDFAGPFQGSMFLIAVDAHSKWPEVHPMVSTTATKTVDLLRSLFAAYGLPEQVVTDNGPQFIAEEFATFMRTNGIRHIRTAPYHPSSNGQAERFVQSFKQAIKASQDSKLPLCHRLSDFLLTYRSTPHATTGAAPASLFLR